MPKYTEQELLQFAGKLAIAAHKVVNAKAKTISLAVEILDSALMDYDEAILSNMNNDGKERN